MEKSGKKHHFVMYLMETIRSLGLFFTGGGGEKGVSGPRNFIGNFGPPQGGKFLAFFGNIANLMVPPAHASVTAAERQWADGRQSIPLALTRSSRSTFLAFGSW